MMLAACASAQKPQGASPAPRSPWDLPASFAGACGPVRVDGPLPGFDTVAIGPHVEAVAQLAEPWVIDMDAGARQRLVAGMADGLVVVSYGCHGLRVLDGCHVAGHYATTTVTPRQEVVRFDDAVEVVGNLPSAGAAVVRALALPRGSTLDVGAVVAAVSRSTVEYAAGNLTGGPACMSATHMVRGVQLGAIALAAGASGSPPADPFISPREVRGDRARCLASKPGNPGPVDGCSEPLRLELVALGVGVDHEQDLPPLCPTGRMLAGGKCVPFQSTVPHRCDPGDGADCELQCARGDQASCIKAFAQIARDPPADKDRARRERAEVALTAACDQGHASACSFLSELVRRRKGAEGQANALLARACDAGDARACGSAAYYADPPQKLARYRQACDLGDGGSCNEAGAVLLPLGGAPAHDLGLFPHVLERSCDTGMSRNCVNLGYAYRDGMGVPADPAKAVAIFDEWCDRGFAEACGSGGWVVRNGQPHDAARVLSFFERGCGLEDDDSCDALALAYMNGADAPKDLDRAEATAKARCAGKSAQGCNMLGLVADARGRWREAAQHYKEACDGGVSVGCSNLGELYADGRGLPRDPHRAAKLFKQGCNDEDVATCARAGFLYEEGIGAPRDVKKAAELYGKGCEALHNPWFCERRKKLESRVR